MWIKWWKWLELPSCQPKIPQVHVHLCRGSFRCWRIKRPFLLFHQGQKPCRPLDWARTTFLGISAARLWRRRRWPPRDGPPGRTKMQAPATPIVVFSTVGFSTVDISSKCADEKSCCIATFALAGTYLLVIPVLSWRNTLTDNYRCFVQLQLHCTAELWWHILECGAAQEGLESFWSKDLQDEAPWKFDLQKKFLWPTLRAKFLRDGRYLLWNGRASSTVANTLGKLKNPKLNFNRTFCL